MIPYSAGAAYNHGGITGSVELLAVPPVRVEDLFASADPKTGVVAIRAIVRNAGQTPAQDNSRSRSPPAAAGETLNACAVEREFPPGDTPVATELKLEQPRLWELNEPFLYRVTARLTRADSASVDELSVRCGFREFRFENGYFRLNGRRLFLRSTHTCNHFPVGLKLPPDPDMAAPRPARPQGDGVQHDSLHLGRRERYQLDLCDEIGLMVYEESFASSGMQDRRQLADRLEPRDHGTDPPRPESSQRRHLGAAERDPGRRSIPSGRRVAAGGAATGRDAHGVSQQRPLGPAGGQLRRVFAVGYLARAARPGALGHAESAGRAGRDAVWFHLAARQVAVHPGPQGEYSVVRWTAPAADRYAVEAIFQGLPQPPATTDAHLLHNGRPLFEARLNLQSQPNCARSAKR